MSQKQFRVLICGGRDQNTEKARYVIERVAIDHFPRTEPDKYGNYLFDVFIIAGGAKGADQAAIDWAVVNWCDFKEYPANWEKYDKAAGPIRNKQMLEEGKPDLVVALPGGKGTANMVKQAKKAGLRVIEIE